MITSAARILQFWFDDLGADGWFVHSAALDHRIRNEFLELYEAVITPTADRAPWLATPATSLALVILLDQLPRNMFRGTARAFAADAHALAAARTALDRGHDLETPLIRRGFYYLPLEHSERLADQDEAVRLFRERADIGTNLKYAELHRDIIRRFGRFPHRNAILGRASTAEEIAYLDNGGAYFGTKPPPEHDG